MAVHAVDEALPKDLIQPCKGARMQDGQYRRDGIKKKKKRTKCRRSKERSSAKTEIVEAKKKRRKMKRSEVVENEENKMAVNADI